MIHRTIESNYAALSRVYLIVHEFVEWNSRSIKVFSAITWDEVFDV